MIFRPNTAFTATKMNADDFPLYPQWRKFRWSGGKGGGNCQQEHRTGCRMCAVLKTVLNVKKDIGFVNSVTLKLYLRHRFENQS